MKNKMIDLNDHLFCQLERLSDEDLTTEQIEQEVARSDAIVSVSDKIIKNAELSLKAAKLFAEHGDRVGRHLPMIAGKKE